MTLILSGTDGLSDVDGTAATPALRGTDANTGIFFPAADTIAFAEGGVEAMRIDSSGRVGIGTTPSGSDGIFTVSINSIGFYLGYDASYDNYYTAGSSGTQIFRTGNTERARIPSTGGIQSVTTISVGNATPSTSGAGITFPATQSASSDANTLDDYEEGTWTPTLANIGTGTYATNTGSYTKIGNRVYLTVVLDINTTGTASGDLQINGFPFTTVSAEPNRSVSGNLLCGSWSSNGTPNIVFMNNNATTATIQDNQGNTVRTHANMGTGSFRFDISYQTA